MKAVLQIGLVAVALVFGAASSAAAQQLRAAGYVTGTGTVALDGRNYTYESFGDKLLWIYGFAGGQVIVVDLSQVAQYWDAASQSYYSGIPWVCYDAYGRYDNSGFWHGAWAGHLRLTEAGFYGKVDYRNYGAADNNWQPVAGGQYWLVR